MAETVEENVSGWWDTMQRQAMTDSDKDGIVNPQRLFWELSGRLPANAIVSSDSGSAANWYARHLKFTTTEQRGSLSGTLATMGPGCRTRSAPSSPTRTVRRSPSRAMAPCR